jgi:hypothetical protein
MVTKDFILQNLEQLPGDLWREVLDFILFLRYKQLLITVVKVGHRRDVYR